MTRIFKPDSGQVLEIQDEGGSAALTIETDGNVTVDAGNLAIGTAGKGIDFSNQASPAAGMTSELLDSFEKGTWTPNFARWTGGDIDATYTTQTGYYTKVGNLVTCVMQINVSAVASQGSSYLGIRGMPFGPTATYGQIAIGVVGTVGCLPAQMEVFSPHHTNNDFYFYKTDRSQYETSGDFTTGEFRASITYMTT